MSFPFFFLLISFCFSSLDIFAMQTSCYIVLHSCLLHGISLCKSTTVGYCIHLLMDLWVVSGLSYFRTVMNSVCPQMTLYIFYLGMLPPLYCSVINCINIKLFQVILTIYTPTTRVCEFRLFHMLTST